MHDERDDQEEVFASLSAAEQKRRRRLAYLQAKQERCQDPDYQALLVAEKARQREAYLQAKALKQAAEQVARQQARVERDQQRAAIRQAKFEALAKLVMPASSLAKGVEAEHAASTEQERQ